MQERYKLTEIGLIPKEWNLSSIGDIADFQGGSQPDIKYFSNQEREDRIRLIQIRDYKTDKYITYIPLHLAKRFCSKDDIMIGRYGPPIFQILRGLEGAYNVALIKTIPKDVCKEFLYYVLNDRKLFEYIELLSRRSSGQTGVDLEGLRNYKIPCPTIDEQEHIAEALSDVDSMISSLEKLIAKKKAVKQGAMQELLTGKKRLPGFDGDIKYKSLASLCTVFADGDWIESKDQSNDGIRLIQTGNIGVGKYLDKTDKQRFISTDTFDRLKCLEIFENDVIVSRLPEPAGRACILPYSNKRRITAVDCTIIRFADYNPILFVAYSQTKQYQDKVDMAMAGSTRQRISRKELGEIPIPVFPTIEEQNAIASILSDLDNEIEALEQKLEKTRQIKQGMMQQLLTGKIRLV